jgi:trk system potassium uptake protein TrkA
MKFCVIGLGRFGFQVATVLGENGMEVLAVDTDEAIVASIRDNVTQAICMHVSNEASLRSIGVNEFDTVIVAMGEFAESILITALLKKHLGVPRVIGRAMNDIHKEILMLTGADLVVLPEKEIGIRLADTLSSPFTDQLRMAEDFSISKLIAPLSFIGKSVKELNLYKTYEVHCIGLQQGDSIISIDPDYSIKQGDKLILSGKNDDLAQVAAF